MRYCLLSGLVEKPISGEWGTGEGQVPVIRTANFTNHGRINFSKVVGRAIVEKKVIAKKLNIDDIIIEKSGGSPTQPVGRVVFFEQGGTYLCNNFTSILRPLKQHVFPKYLHYILFCNHKYGFVCKFQNKTTGIINLQLSKYIKNTKIPLPSLVEQKTIAAILDAADRLRQKDAQLIAKYNALSQSLFLDMFGDFINTDLIPLKELVKFSQGQQFPLEEQLLVPKDGYSRFLRITDFTQGDDLRFVPNCNEKYFVKKDDIVIVRYGASAGFVGMDKEGILANNLFKVVFDRNQFHHLFLFFVFNHGRFKSFLKKEAFGAAMAALSFKVMERFKVPVPPITLQNQFAERIQHIEAQKQQAQAALQKSDDLFHSLLQHAFKGELTA